MVGATRVGHDHAWSGDPHGRLPRDEVAEELRRVAVLESAELAGEHGVERVGQSGEHDVEVDLDEDGRGERVEAEELHRLGNTVLDPPAARVVADEAGGLGRAVVADEERRLLVAVAANDELAYLALVAWQADGRFVHLGVGVLALGMRDVNALPAFELLHRAQEGRAAAAQGDELDAGGVELGELLVAREAGVEDEGGETAAPDLAPEGEEVGDLLVGLAATGVGRRVEQQLRLRVL